MRNDPSGRPSTRWRPTRRQQRDGDTAHPGPEVADGVGGDVASRERGAEQDRGTHDRRQPHQLGQRLLRAVDGDEDGGDRPRADEHDAQDPPRTERHTVADERRDRDERHRRDREHDRRGGARGPRRTLAHVVADAREVERLDVVEAGSHGHSDRRTTAGRVRAARRAGTAATRLTARTAAGTSSRMASTGHVGSAETPSSSATRTPDEPPDDEPQGDADEQGDDGDGRGVPRDGGTHLTTSEAERLQHREVTPTPPHGGHEREADGDQRDHRDEHGERDRQAIDLADPVDLGRNRRTLRRRVGPGDGLEARHAPSPRSTPGANRTTVVQLLFCAPCGVDAGRAGTGEHRTVGERLRITEPAQQCLPDNAVPEGPPLTAYPHRVADALVDRGERLGTERHLVGCSGRAATDDRRTDVTEEVGEAPPRHRMAVDVELERCRST